MSCRIVKGVRVLANRHEDGCGDLACPGCQPCPDPHCGTCERNHADDTCASCINVARNNLAAIAELHQHLWYEAIHGRRARHVHDAVPGGDAVVLLVPGPTSSTYRGVLADRIDAELDVSHVIEEHRTDPRPPLTVLATWEETWRLHAEQPTSLPRTMERVVDYLDEQLHLMARDPRFPTYAKELARTVRRLEDVLYDGDRPDVTRVPCLDCGTRLIKCWAETEEADHWKCPRCGEVYDRGRYDRAKHDHLHSAGADRFVPISVAVGTIGRPEQTVRTWIRKGRVEVKRDPKTGRVLVWWPDVRSLHLVTAARRRAATRPT